MGTLSVTVEAGSSQGKDFRSPEALVDTGASYATLPTSLLRELGVALHGQRPLLLAAGDTVVRDIGRTWVRIDGQTEMTIVVFGDYGASPLLGAVTLKEFGLGVDQVARKLVPVPGLLT